MPVVMSSVFSRRFDTGNGIFFYYFSDGIVGFSGLIVNGNVDMYENPD